MRIICIPLLLLVQSANAEDLKQHVTITGKNLPLAAVFKTIQKQTGYLFVYEENLLKKTSAVDLNVKDAPLTDVLNITLRGQGLLYEIKYNTIVIRGDEPRAVVSLVKAAEKTVFADRVIRGRVTTEKAEPIAGVTVTVKGTEHATTTNEQGEFTMTLEEGARLVLVFSSVGFGTREMAVGSASTVNVSLAEQANDLREVVVTALGIEKKTKSITYATQNISGAELSRVKDVNFMNSLAGKAAGVVITKGNAGPGASTRVILRGNKSITGNNQPLYVIDGVPMNNAASTSANTLFSQQDFGDAISNLNSEDIESIQVLKGASAAALYGSQAANGVILISTKKGKKGTARIDVSSTATFDNPIALPENQTTYGQRDPGVTNESWGAAITNGKNSHIKDFFNTGTNFLNSVSVSAGNELGQVYLSYANTAAKGIVPENDMLKHNINLRGTAQLFKGKLTLDGSINYISQYVKNRPQTGYYLSPIFSLYLFPTGDDFSKYSGSNYQVWDPVRLLYKQNWPYVVNEASSNQNPYWIQNRNQNDMNRDRVIATFSGKYRITSWLSAQARATVDKVQDTYEQRVAATTDPVLASLNGGYSKSNTNNNQLYSDFLLTGNKDISDNFSISATLGYTFTKNKTYGMSFSSVTSSGLSYPNYFSIFGLRFPFNSGETLRRSFSQATFGTATLGYKDRLFLDVTGRNEYSTTVDETFFYPSAGLSYVVLDNAGSKGVSFIKVRGSYSEVGNALPIGVSNYNPRYSLSNDENINPRGSLPYFSGKDTIRLQPERTKSYEIGTEIRMLKDRLSINLTYYNASTYNQVFTIGAPAGSGATNFYINGGTIRNKGIEAVVSYNASLGKIKWTPSLNISHNKNQIIELSKLLTTPRFVLTTIDATRQVQLFLTRPENGNYGSYGDLYGKRIQYDKDGAVVVDAGGLPVLSKDPDQYIGNANPNFLAGLNNTFTYKNINLSFLVDARFGGKIVSVTETWRDWKGLSERTAEARNNQGVSVNGKLVSAEQYYKRVSGSGQQGAAELYAYDATNVRLRELALGYTLPKLIPAIKDITLSFVARNLLFFYKNAPFDPEVNIAPANGLQGLEAFNLPSTRSYGLTLRAGF